MFPDLEAAKRFYGELLGWTFGDSAADFGHYTQAYVDGKTVAGVLPRIPGMDGAAAWNLYFASPDARVTAAKIVDNGGTLAMEPMDVADVGTMVTAEDPGGVSFSVWQAGTHPGFEVTGEPGAYAWADLCTREVAETDAFFPSVFPFKVQRIEAEGVDFHLWDVGGDPVIGRLRMTDEFPPGTPPFINVHFTVADVDTAVATVERLGGASVYGPMDSPFGRFATVRDQQGAMFSVIDLQTRVGEVPAFS